MNEPNNSLQNKINGVTINTNQIKNQSILNTLLPKSPYLLAYFAIFLVLWDTKGMTNPKDPSFPFASVFLSIIFIGLIIFSFIKKRSEDLANTHFLSLILFAQFIFFLIGNFSSHHYLYTYAKKTSYLWLFNSVFYTSLGIYMLSFVFKKYQSILLRILLITSILFTLLTIYCSIETGIDTHLFLNMASDYFMQFNNPYNYTYPDIYNGEFNEVYGNKYYFNYWPMALYICSIFRFLFNDVRYAFALAQIIFVIILIKNRQNLSIIQVTLIAVIWLSNLVVLYVNERSWLDALVVPFFIAALLSLNKGKYVWASILIGLMASIKLYYVFVMPFFGLYFIRERRFKEVFIMGLAFISTFIPFVLLSFDSFYNSTIVFINDTKVREDSLSVVSAIKRIFDIDVSQIGFYIMFSLMGIFTILYLRGKNNVLNLTKYINLTFFAIFLSSKQSFCNYFYFNMACTFIIFYLESNFNFKDQKANAKD